MHVHIRSAQLKVASGPTLLIEAGGEEVAGFEQIWTLRDMTDFGYESGWILSV